MKRACTGNEEDVNRKQSTGNREMITDEKGYWICASLAQVEGLEVEKRRYVLPWE